MIIYIDGYEIDLTTFVFPAYIGGEVPEEEFQKLGRALIFADRLIATK